MDLYYIMEQLTTLRSEVVQRLLESTSNVSIKRMFLYMAEKAKGGYGVLITEDYCIQEHMKGYARIPGLWKDDQMKEIRN